MVDEHKMENVASMFEDIQDKGQGGVGIFRTPASPIISLVVGHKSGKILARRSGIIEPANILMPGLPNPNFVFDKYEHRWHCVISCDSHLHWTAHCVDQRDGSIIQWDNVEVGAQDSTEGVTPDNVESRHYTHHFEKATHFSVDWDKDGHDPDFNSGAKCWLGAYWWFWSFSSHA